MEKPIYDFVMERLKAGEETYQQIATGSGVSRRTVEKIARKEIEDPGVSNIQRLADYFHKRKPSRALA